MDDGSTDKTEKIVKSFGDQLIYLRQENQGGSAARNRGIEIARGKYVVFLDSDDQFHPKKLEKAKKYIKKHPHAKFIYTWYYHTDRKGKITLLRKGIHPRSLNEFRYLLLNRIFTVRTSTVILHRKVFDKVGMFNENYPYTHDWDMWLRLAKRYRGHCIPKPLSYYRFHSSMISRQKRKVSYRREIRNHALTLYGWSDKTIKKLEKKYGDYRKKLRRNKRGRSS